MGNQIKSSIDSQYCLWESLRILPVVEEWQQFRSNLQHCGLFSQAHKATQSSIFPHRLTTIREAPVNSSSTMGHRCAQWTRNYGTATTAIVSSSYSSLPLASNSVSRLVEFANFNEATWKVLRAQSGAVSFSLSLLDFSYRAFRAASSIQLLRVKRNLRSCVRNTLSRDAYCQP